MEFLHFPELSWDIIGSWGFSILHWLYCPAVFRFGYLGDGVCFFFLVQTTRLHESFLSIAISSRSIARGSFFLEKMPSVGDSCFFCSFWNFEYNGVFGP